eukprot:25306-Pyramimonas_sp.AAC.1
MSDPMIPLRCCHLVVFGAARSRSRTFGQARRTPARRSGRLAHGATPSRSSSVARHLPGHAFAYLPLLA